MYHWIGQLAPAAWVPLASYVTGVLLLVGSIANLSSGVAVTVPARLWARACQ